MPYLHRRNLEQIQSRTEQSTGQRPPPEEERIQCQRNIVKHQVEELYKLNPARSTEDDDFSQYQIDVNTVIFQGTYSSIYLASFNQDNQSQEKLIGRVYEPTARIDAQRSSYLKVLKHIGRRSPYCIGTWDIFFDEAGRVVVFQEYAAHGNLKDYLLNNNVFVPEPMLHKWVVQIYRGMDFLGNAGICHRAISPKHIFLLPSPEEASRTIVKLGSFRDSFIYYDPLVDNVRAVPCRERKDSAGANFKAPELFVKDGAVQNKELECDPITAEVYSYGATFFFANTRHFPVRFLTTLGDTSPVIEKSINNAKFLSQEAKNWFSGLLKADPAERTPFEKIPSDPWFQRGPKKSDDEDQPGRQQSNVHQN